MENYCHKFGAKLDNISLEVEFQQDEITLDFPEGKVRKGSCMGDYSNDTSHGT